MSAYAVVFAVAALVTRFNVEGLAAVVPRHGGGRLPGHTALERERILVEARRIPDRERDGTAVWSLTTLQRALRRNGLPHVSTSTMVVFQTWILYQNTKFISVDKETNNDVMHLVEFGETNRLSYQSFNACP